MKKKSDGDLGVHCKVVGFACPENLESLYSEKDRTFREWRKQFDAGLVDAATHPLYCDRRYQQVSAQIDQLFSGFRSPQFEKVGVMLVESGEYVFRPLETVCQSSADEGGPIKATN